MTVRWAHKVWDCLRLTAAVCARRRRGGCKNTAGRTRVPLSVTPFQPASAEVGASPPSCGSHPDLRASSSLLCSLPSTENIKDSSTTDTYLFRRRETRSEDWILLRILFHVKERITKLSFCSFFNL